MINATGLSDKHNIIIIAARV
ncbi:hypothetical protein PP583_gp02 [Pseudoalteromonas phage HS6]|nr:hypothetical protein PP583_gp02 [Pseudoalteromonas phage HS6]